MTPLLPPLALNKHILRTFHYAGHEDQLTCWLEVFAETVAAGWSLGFEDLVVGGIGVGGGGAGAGGEGVGYQGEVGGWKGGWEGEGEGGEERGEEEDGGESHVWGRDGCGGWESSEGWQCVG